MIGVFELAQAVDEMQAARPTEIGLDPQAPYDFLSLFGDKLVPDRPDVTGPIDADSFMFGVGVGIMAERRRISTSN